MIFERGLINLEGSVQKKLLACYLQHYKIRKHRDHLITTLVLMLHLTMVFFDGASQAHGVRCGACRQVILNQSHRVMWKLYLGGGSNTKG